MRVASFFSGIGGFERALPGEVVFQVEREPFCREVLARRFPGVPCHDDIEALVPGDVPDADIWVGGFPCQGISAAGKGAGLSDHRSGLWRPWARLIAAQRPAHVLIENSPRLRTRGLDEVLADLGAAGYDARWMRLSAWDAGAWHWRERLWILAGPSGSWAEPGLFGDQTALGELPADGLMVAGRVYRTPTVTSGRPPTMAQAQLEELLAGTVPAREALPTADAGGFTSNQGGGAGRVGPVRHGLAGLARMGALPTATAGDARASGSRSLQGSGAHPGRSLTDAVLHGGGTERRALPTACAVDAGGSSSDRDPQGRRGKRLRDIGRAALLSPASRDYRSGNGRQENGHAPQLPERIGGVIHPGWLECFMGFPVGWTDPLLEAPEALDLPAAWLDGSWWSAAPPAVAPPRTIDRRPSRVKAIGNAVLPQVAALAYRLLTTPLGLRVAQIAEDLRVRELSP